MYKVCEPSGAYSTRELYFYEGEYYKPTFYKGYKHLINGLRLHYFFSKHESVINDVQVTGNDYNSVWMGDIGYCVIPPPRTKKGVYILDHDDKQVDIGLLIVDIENSEGDGRLTVENIKFVEAMRKRQAQTNFTPNYILRADIQRILKNKEHEARQRCEFRKDSIPCLFNGRQSYDFIRPIRYFPELKKAEAAKIEVDLEETDLRIRLKIRAKRNPSNLPNPWDLESWNSRYDKKSWKAQTKARKQWAKHKPRIDTEIPPWRTWDLCDTPDLDEY